MKDEPSLFAQFDPKPTPIPLKREKKGVPIIVDRDRDVIEEWQIYTGNRRAGCPKVILDIARRSKNAIIAGTGELGWMVYAENEQLEVRAFYFREDVDDPDLSRRCMMGLEP